MPGMKISGDIVVVGAEGAGWTGIGNVGNCATSSGTRSGSGEDSLIVGSGSAGVVTGIVTAGTVVVPPVSFPAGEQADANKVRADAVLMAMSPKRVPVCRVRNLVLRLGLVFVGAISFSF